MMNLCETIHRMARGGKAHDIQFESLRNNPHDPKEEENNDESRRKHAMQPKRDGIKAENQQNEKQNPENQQ